MDIKCLYFTMLYVLHLSYFTCASQTLFSILSKLYKPHTFEKSWCGHQDGIVVMLLTAQPDALNSVSHGDPCGGRGELTSAGCPLVNRGLCPTQYNSHSVLKKHTVY